MMLYRRHFDNYPIRTSHCILHLPFCLQCDIAQRNPFSQNNLLYGYVSLHLIWCLLVLKEWTWVILHIHGYLIQGCGIAMPDLSDSYTEPAGQVDFPG